MSNSLVRTSLEIFGYEDDLKYDKAKKRKNRSKGAPESRLWIPENHRIINKTGKKRSKTLGFGNKLTVHEAKKHLESKVDPTEENVRKLLLLSSSHLDFETSEKLINRALTKSHPKKEKKREPESTAFTEEDFATFEKEYTKS